MTKWAVFLIFISTPIFAVLQDCSPEESAILQGKCSLHVNELMIFTDDKEVSLEVAKNISKVCQSITKCYEDIQCADAQRNKEMYEQKCQRLDYKNYLLKDCMTKVYDIINDKLVNCTEQFDYSSNNLTTKREAFTSGKSCFMSLVDTNCSSKSIAHFHSNYDSFLNILTVPPANNEKCNLVHDELTAAPCIPLQTTFMAEEMSLVTIMLKRDFSVVKRLRRVCEQLQECTVASCFFSAMNFTIRNEDTCTNIDTIQRKTDFAECHLTTILKANLTNYDCIPSNATMPSFVKRTTKPNFYDDKECAKKVMVGECGQNVTIGFDENWSRQVEL
ncbi:hypothetical protein CAEBREN_23041 [Caenorhabditis brenneri]|uniref:T20D4.11-like domain-containing protein n=1 Tax=Caenorhabditis brenneri TaxID=135651 RepID=G0M9X6_CAEBE|nr:hypothetical protein CAEBREN_23041 [Caenorhabditis brenneri]